MSGAGASLLKADGSGLRVAIVASTWHEEIMNGLIDGASRACAEAGVEATLIRVAGSFELPIVAQACARSDFDAIIALGVIIRGDTPHFEFVSDRFRAIDLRHRKAGSRSCGSARFGGGQGCRGHLGRGYHGCHAGGSPYPLGLGREDL